MPKYSAKEEEKIPKTFTCRDSQEPRNGFKRFDLLRNGKTLKASQIAYLKNLDIPAVRETSTKDEIQRKLTAEETTTLKYITGWLS